MSDQSSFPVEDEAQRPSELRHKHERILEWVAERQIDGLLIARHENIAWATAGVVDIRVGMLRETGPASLLFTRHGEKFYLTTNNEAERLQTEEFAGLGFKPIVQPWYSYSLSDAIGSVLWGGKVVADIALGVTPALSFYELRGPLTEGEIARYRWLGKTVALIVSEIALTLQPGMREREMQAMVAGRLLPEGILPSVSLTAVDSRVRRFPHPVPRDAALNRLAMICLCARRWGLTVALSRFIHFGSMPKKLAENFSTVTNVAARLLLSTKEGASSDFLFHIAEHAYAELGFPGAEKRHHQGGAIGYMEREWFARPGGKERIRPIEAVAWNPSFEGAKCEDTVLCQREKLEILTATAALPAALVLPGAGIELTGVLQR